MKAIPLSISVIESDLALQFLNTRIEGWSIATCLSVQSVTLPFKVIVFPAMKFKHYYK